jgi:hypothetical protein
MLRINIPGRQHFAVINRFGKLQTLGYVGQTASSFSALPFAPAVVPDTLPALKRLVTASECLYRSCYLAYAMVVRTAALIALK